MKTDNQVKHEATAKEQRAKLVSLIESGTAAAAGLLGIFDAATTEGQRCAKLADETIESLEALKDSAGATRGRTLSKEVEADYQRRIGLGIHPEAAMEAAVKQVQHNKNLEDPKHNLASLTRNKTAKK